MKTPLAKVKHLGSARSGTHHHVNIRVTAVFMLVLLNWFIISTVYLMAYGPEVLGDYMRAPMNLFMAIMFIGTSLYHATLGLQTVIEDYVHCRMLKISALIGLYFFNIVTFVASCVTVFGIHIVGLIIKIFN
ncbi:MAG: succinate dehydrogenase, hydrophobic membrane anchor protein [Rickettsiales bacterium]